MKVKFSFLVLIIDFSLYPALAKIYAKSYDLF